MKSSTELAQALVDATDEEQMHEAEGAILDHLGVSEDETFAGLTERAVFRVEDFVSATLDNDWTYADSKVVISG